MNSWSWSGFLTSNPNFPFIYNISHLIRVDYLNRNITIWNLSVWWKQLYLFYRMQRGYGRKSRWDYHFVWRWVIAPNLNNSVTTICAIPHCFQYPNVGKHKYRRDMNEMYAVIYHLCHVESLISGFCQFLNWLKSPISVSN